MSYNGGSPALIRQWRIRPTVQQKNLAGDPRCADKLTEMETLLLAEMRRLDDPFRLWDQPTDDIQ